MKAKKIIAVIMSLCMVAGEVSYSAPFISQAITAQAATITEADCYSFNSITGVLTLRGEVDRYAVYSFSSKSSVKKIIAEAGTVLPKYSYDLFSDYENCISIDLSNADTSNVTDMQHMFSNCYKLTTVDVSGFDTSNVTRMSGMFSMCTSLTSLDVSNFDTSHVTNMASMFVACNNLRTLDVSNFDTSRVTNMFCMFCHCENLKSLDLRSFDTSKVTDMGYMFSECSSLTSIDVSSFDTSKATNMEYMFHKCSDLKFLILKSFNTSSVLNMQNMFWKCSSLKALDLRSFNTNSVLNMRYMFDECSSLTSLDVSSFDTNKVEDMQCIFSNCSSLSSLDLSNFDTSNVTDMISMFWNCNMLKTLTLGKNFKKIPQDASLPNGDGWVNVKAPTTIVSGYGKYAIFENNGKNTYKPYSTITYPTNIKYTYSQAYHQLQFTWDKVKDADRYSIAVYQAGKWVIQKDNITTNSFVTPKNLTPGKTYKVAIAARVDGKWDTTNALKNAVTVTIPADKDGYDIYDLDPNNSFDYSFLNDEIYRIGMYHDDENYSLPIEVTSESSVKISDTFEYECDEEQYFRFKWCNNGYKICPVKYESSNKVLTINQSGEVVLEEDKNLLSQIWEVLPYGKNKYGDYIDGLRIRSKICYTSDCKPTSYFLSYNGSKLIVTNKEVRNKVKIYSPTVWKRFGELYLNCMGWEKTNVPTGISQSSVDYTIENYIHNIGYDLKENTTNYCGHDLLVKQDGGVFKKLKFHEQTMDGVCCEIMGTYNALVMHDEPVDFFKLAAEFEMNATSTEPIGDSGYWGSDPYKIGNCLDAYNVNYTTIDIDDYIVDYMVSNNKDLYNCADPAKAINEEDYNKINKPACDAFDKELKNGVCGIISYKWPTDGEGYLPLGLKLPTEEYLGIHTYASIYDGSYSSAPISTFNLVTSTEPADSPEHYSSTFDALHNYDKDTKELINVDRFLVGYVLK